MNTNNIVMWEILLNNADWDCFKILTSREILKIQNPLQEEHYVFLEVIHLFQQVGCVRSKHQFLTVQQNLRLNGIPALDSWDVIVLVLGNTTQNHDRTEKLVVCRDANHERSMLNEFDIDLRIPGLPHSVVKQADNYRVIREEDREPPSPTISSTRSTTKQCVQPT